ncbi:MAG: carbohydrate-binding protein [Actinobacteria bacterium]|nr:MAG: carbohydrate-binding protein [Actinomycetota bacterium]
MTRSTLVRTLLVGGLVVAAGTTAVTLPLLASAATTVYEAESATISQGVVANNHASFTGTGFVDYNNVSGSYVEFSVPASKAGTVTLSFRYANGGTTDRPVAVTVNGTSAGTLAEASTGDWATWQTAKLTATLASGTNKIRATATTASGGGNLDSLTVTDGGTPTTDWSLAVVKSTMAGPAPTSWAYPVALYMYGQYLVFQRTHDPKLLSYIQTWADRFVAPDGTIDQVQERRHADREAPGAQQLPAYQRQRALARHQPAAPAVGGRHLHGAAVPGELRRPGRGLEAEGHRVRRGDQPAHHLQHAPPVAERPAVPRVRRVGYPVVGGAGDQALAGVVVPGGRLVRDGDDDRARHGTDDAAQPGQGDHHPAAVGDRDEEVPGPGERPVVPGGGQGHPLGQLDRDVVLVDVHVHHLPRGREGVRGGQLQAGGHHRVPRAQRRRDGRRTRADLAGQRRPHPAGADLHRYQRRRLRLLHRPAPGHQRFPRPGLVPHHERAVAPHHPIGRVEGAPAAGRPLNTLRRSAAWLTAP